MIFLRFFERKSSITAAFLLATFFLSFISFNLTFADIWSGRPSTSSRNSRSYFDNKVLFTINGNCPATGGTASVLPEIYGGQAIPGTVQSVASLVSFLKSNNRANDAGSRCTQGKWQKGGSAFVVQTMLGRTGDQANANGGRNVSDADFDDLTRRLNAATIDWNQPMVSTDGINTEAMWSPSSQSVDVAHFNEAKKNTAIVITSAGGNVYKIYRQCANPIGSTNGIAAAPKDYNLNPTITANQTAAEAGSPVTISPVVANTGSATSVNTQWQLSQFTLPSGTNPVGGGNSPAAPAAYYGNGLVRVTGGTGAGFPPKTSTPIGTSNLNLPDVPPGSKVCYALSVQARSDTDGQWAHSNAACVTIAKKPKVQVWGGDLAVGLIFNGNTIVAPSKIDTSTSAKSIGGAPPTTFGSWIEYGIFATGSVTGAASGSAFAGTGFTGNSAAFCQYSTLTFTNSGTSTCGAGTKLGSYGTAQSIPDVASSFPVVATTPSFGNNPTIDLSSGNPQGLYTATGNVSITGGGAGKVIGVGQWVVLNAPTANVTITGNINYTTATLHDIQDIPQVVIIAKNITIADTVTNVDAWLIANGGKSATDGKLNTCASAATPAVSLVVAQCNQMLTVNGPVMAQKLYLNRTGGSGVGPASGDPAEIFNLRPDAYLWGYARATSGGQVHTVYSNELPPRF